MNNSMRRFCGIERLEPRRLLSLGEVDSTFSGDGGHSYSFEGEQSIYDGSSFDFARDGKIIVAATTRGRDSKSQILLARLDVGGVLDRTFGSDGQVITAFDGQVSWDDTLAVVKKVRVQRDGKILVGGSLGRSWAVFRFNSDGSLDRSFDHDGMQTFRSHPGASVVDMELLANGKIVVGGWAEGEPYPSTHHRDFGLARLKSNGAIDRSFGIDGYVVSDLGYYDRLEQIAVDGAGNIVAAGVSFLSERSGAPAIVLTRYRSNGTVDLTFGKWGRVITKPRSVTEPRRSTAAVSSLETLRNGRILVSGSNREDAFLMRLNKRGLVDSSFAERGSVSFDLGGTNDRAIVLRADRKHIVALGIAGEEDSYPPKDTRQFLLNFGANGSPEGSSERRELSLESDGVKQLNGGARIVRNNQVVALFTSRDDFGAGQLTFARFEQSGAVDADFGKAGEVTIPIKGPLRSQPMKVVAQADGKSVVLVNLATYGKGTSSLLRMNAGGELDSSFGKGGQVALEADQSTLYPALALDSGGKMLVAGTKWDFNGSFAQRFNVDGSVDISFGDHGRAAVEQGADVPEQIVPLADGKLLLGGIMGGGIGEWTLAITRLNVDGSVDKSFGQNGTILEKFDDANDIDHIFIGAGGRLTVVGVASRYHDMAGPDPVRVFVARYNADGSVDRSFARILMEDTQSTYDARLLADGGVVLLAPGNSEREFKLIRFKADGTAGGTTTREAPGKIEEISFEEDGQILLLTATSTLRLSADGSTIKGSQAGVPIEHVSYTFGRYDARSVITITPDHKLVVAGEDGDGDLTLWRYLLE